MRIAHVVAGIVVNVSEGSLQETSALFPQHTLVDVSATSCGIGWAWDGANFTPPEQPRRSVISRVEFMERFTDSELIAILVDAKTRNATALALNRLAHMDHIDLSAAPVVNRVNALESLGLIATGRAAQILAY